MDQREVDSADTYPDRVYIVEQDVIVTVYPPNRLSVFDVERAVRLKLGQTVAQITAVDREQEENGAASEYIRSKAKGGWSKDEGSPVDFILPGRILQSARSQRLARHGQKPLLTTIPASRTRYSPDISDLPKLNKNKSSVGGTSMVSKDAGATGQSLHMVRSRSSSPIPGTAVVGPNATLESRRVGSPTSIGDSALPSAPTTPAQGHHRLNVATPVQFPRISDQTLRHVNDHRDIGASDVFMQKSNGITKKNIEATNCFTPWVKGLRLATHHRQQGKDSELLDAGTALLLPRSKSILEGGCLVKQAKPRNIGCVMKVSTTVNWTYAENMAKFLHRDLNALSHYIAIWCDICSFRHIYGICDVGVERPGPFRSDFTLRQNNLCLNCGRLRKTAVEG
nr:hypothetical protein CFP56_64887 [Quercus suber]